MSSTSEATNVLLRVTKRSARQSVIAWVGFAAAGLAACARFGGAILTPVARGEYTAMFLFLALFIVIAAAFISMSFADPRAGVRWFVRVGGIGLGLAVGTIVGASGAWLRFSQERARVRDVVERAEASAAGRVLDPDSIAPFRVLDASPCRDGSIALWLDSPAPFPAYSMTWNPVNREWVDAGR